MLYNNKMSNIQANIQKLKQEIPENIKLVAVSKYSTEENIQEAYNSGINNFGENKLQDAESKINNLKNIKELNINWHYIGHLQSNKARKCVNLFDYIHSVDSPRLLEKINNISFDTQKNIKVFIQIKLAEDENKTGMSPADFIKNLQYIKTLEDNNQYLEVIGLMTILPQGLTEAEQENLFCQLAQLKEQANKILNLTELSMGMSQDYKLAIKQNSTYVRIGSAIFNNK